MMKLFFIDTLVGDSKIVTFSSFLSLGSLMVFFLGEVPLILLALVTLSLFERDIPVAPPWTVFGDSYAIPIFLRVPLRAGDVPLLLKLPPVFTGELSLFSSYK